VVSAPADEALRLSAKANGDDTRRLYADLRTGINARVVGPFGMFDYWLGELRQIWIAAWIGITPFISWIRALNGSLEYEVDLYYSTADEASALFAGEITAATARYPSLALRLIRTDRDPPLTPGQIWSANPITRSSVYMCGPPEMMRTFQKELRAHRVAPDHIRREQFGLR
jgi:predicted ferric reductase